MSETKCVIFGIVIIALFALIAAFHPTLNLKGLFNLYGVFAAGLFGLVSGYGYAKHKIKDNKKDKKDN